jgi:hypothetical protein
MAIDPVNGSTAGTGRANASQTGAAQQSAPDAARATTVRQGTSDADPGDTIQLSTTTLELQSQAGAAAAPPAGTVTTEQMQAVLGRVTSGYYDQSSTRSAVAQSIWGALTDDEGSGR